MIRRTALKRTANLSRHTRIAPASARRRRKQRERRKAMLAAFGETPVCAIRWDDRCHGRADAPHELRKASQGGSRVSPANAIPACHPCNSAVEDFPDEAHRRGFVIRRGDVA